MNRFKDILFVAEPAGVDETAFRRALKLAQAHQARLAVIDVMETVPAPFASSTWGMASAKLQQIIADERRERLERLVASVTNEVQISIKLLTGCTFLEVIREVLRNKHDLVVKSAEGSDVSGMGLFGGNDMHLLRKCPCPVLLMRPLKEEKFRSVVAAVDIDPEGAEGYEGALNRQILEMASGIALADLSEMHIVHAWEAFGENALRRSRDRFTDEEVDNYLTSEEQRHRIWLEELVDMVDKQQGDDVFEYIKPKLHLTKGRPREALPTLVSNLVADLIVMGTVARTGISGFFMGNTAEIVLHKIECSVLAIKPQGFVTPVTLEE